MYKRPTDYHKLTNSIKKEKSLKKKQEFLKTAPENYLKGLRYAYDPLITFGGHIPERNTEDTLTTGQDFKDFEELVSKLTERRASKEDILKFANGVPEAEWEGYYKLVLNKDFKMGLGLKSINEVVDVKIPVFSCMLAQSQTITDPSQVSGKYYVDTKYDGMRLVAFLKPKSEQVTLYTRTGHTIELPHLEEQFLRWFKRGMTQDLVLDGELIGDSFKDVISNVKATDGNTDHLVYQVFDCVPLVSYQQGEYPHGIRDRDIVLQSLIHAVGGSKSIQYVPKELVNMSTPEGQRRFKEIYNKATSEGAEGVMLKAQKSPYVTRRSSDWLKVKPSVDLDLEVIEVHEGTGRNEGRMGHITCANSTVTVDVGGGFTDEQREDFWKRRDEISRSGFMVEVKGDSYTEGSLRFPRFVRTREDKNE